MSATRANFIIALVALSFCAACEPDKPVRPAPPKVKAKGVLPAIAAHAPKPTTPGMRADHSMREGIKQLRRAVKDQPKSVELRQSMVSALLQRAKFVGRLNDYDEALGLAEETVRIAEKDRRAYVFRARVYAALHRFEEALADLDKAEELGSVKTDTALARGTIAMGLGKYDDAFEIISAHRSKYEDTTSCALEAAALGRRGKAKDAHALFIKALELYRRPAPYTIAWVYFENGAMWERAGDKDRARALYQKAVDKLPSYAHAVAHLAALSKPKEAVELLTPVVKRSSDPEYAATLATLMNEQQKGSGKQMLKASAAGYAQLLKRHPLAFADHAGWFYLNVLKDADRAVDIAEANVKARAVPEAYELLVAAQLGANEKIEACASARKGLELTYPSLSLKAVAADAFEQCGRKDRATELRKELAANKPGG
jgi:tetratricopeptide (TPR) repeat protein